MAQPPFKKFSGTTIAEFEWFVGVPFILIARCTSTTPIQSLFSKIAWLGLSIIERESL
jgi:hypothetical protein